MRQMTVAAVPALDVLLPAQWPTESPVLDEQRTVSALRAAMCTLNEGLLIIGFGDGTVIELLRNDPNARKKLIHLIVLKPELETFAYGLGAVDFEKVFKELQMALHFVQDEADLAIVLSKIYNEHGNIARLAGTTILDSHIHLAIGSGPDNAPELGIAHRLAIGGWNASTSSVPSRGLCPYDTERRRPAGVRLAG
jgi:hypothetical protein